MTRPLYPEERNVLKVMFADAGVRPVLYELSRLCQLRVDYMAFHGGDRAVQEQFEELRDRLHELSLALAVC